jgi:hypothetical protein
MDSGGAFGAFGNIFAPYPEQGACHTFPSSVHSRELPSSLDPAAAQFLADHVARVKLQAAEAEHDWSIRNDNLARQNRSLLQQVQKLERVVRENSLQWRLRERDDWKNLVSAVQRDRDRLEEENSRMSRTVSSLKRQLQSNGIEPQEPITAAAAAAAAATPTTAAAAAAAAGGGPSAASSSTPATSSASARATDVPHPDSDNIPQATMMRFKELEAQLAESLCREDGLRQRLQHCEGELQSWKVEKQADLLAMIEALQHKLNLELEQKWARNRGYRPLRSPNKSSFASTGLISRFVEVIAPYPEVANEFDETHLLNVAKHHVHDEDDEKT